MFAVFASLLCLVSLSHSAPLACENLVRPFEQLDTHNLVGRWALVAGSLKDPESVDVLKGKDSVTIDFNNGTYTQANRYGEVCSYHSRDISVESHVFNLQVGNFNFTGTFLHTSCPDCVVLNWSMKSPDYKSVDLYLFSRRREVDQKEMEDFRAQVECLNMPTPVVMDSTKELCPQQTRTEEKKA